MKKISLSLIVLLLFNVLIFNVFIKNYKADELNRFKDLPKVEKINKISALTDLGVEEAIKNNEYNCATDPVCKTCFVQGSKWNDDTAGTCKCAEFIARGESPCPECEKNIKIKEENNRCNTDSSIPVCDIKI